MQQSPKRAVALRPRRSILYVPGSNARALDKAAGLPADGLILDLEDSVAPDMKDPARRAVAERVAARAFGGREVIVRVNGADTPWGAADLAAVAEAGPDAVLLPKVESDDEVIEAGRVLDRLGAPATLSLWAMIETPLAALRPEQVAAAREAEVNTRLTCLVVGTNDLAKVTRARLKPGRAAFMPYLTAAVAAARAYGLDVIDGVCNALDDPAAFEAECVDGRDLGMDGKTLIHPSQIEAANRVFAPDAGEIAEARRIIDAFSLPENRSRGAIALDGRMVERLHADIARRTLALAEAIAAAS
ncbi:citrate lyase subunit beta / citryl-CoA lyase [Pseudoxanthobacter soli DSM 19599]|uniref:Citrate lyase subunit beta / citryl-CoA lyase n=1 Tax=Pseudoxanthobacter soli DSM 19599 TaxID=1123029 RepID=A0A1M7ZFC0_9HYPH|nr:CoA ester lyase [Pseudoxanthobacter soli]SHO63600.1 citrate lyase subunit beta / citryl-CoA lyase [Pseudoxanthobacter soli DSM 19599]